MTKPLEPASEAEVAEIIRKSHSSSQTVEIIGGQTRAGFGHRVDAQTRISTGKLDGIQIYEPGALTLVAKAGTPLSSIKKALADEGQHLAFEPADYCDLLGTRGETTIGGVVAAGISGPRRIQAGACRDALIGVRFVSGEGEIIKNGGRVMKNVTGYDLVKLLCGSHGTLGLISEVAFKLLPQPECTNVIILHGLSDQQAAKAMSMALTSPYDVTGAAHTPKGLDGEPVTMIRVEGFENSVSYRSGQLKELLAELAPADIETNAKNTTAGWQWVRDVEIFANRQGAVWKLSVNPTDGADVVSQINRKLETEVLYDWGGGLIWLLVPPEIQDAGAPMIRAAVDSHNGHATLVRASDDIKKQVSVFHPQSGGVKALSDAIKAKFDPANILNTGRMGPR